MKDYDLIVIGAGAAGSSCAEKVNEAGKKVALIERDMLGGTCLNYGCDPTKAALHKARLWHDAPKIPLLQTAKNGDSSAENLFTSGTDRHFLPGAQLPNE